MNHLETLLESATREARQLRGEIFDLKGRLAYALEHQTNIVQTWGGYTFEQFKAIINDNHHKTERLQWLYNEPDKPNNRLSYWQKLVVEEALGLVPTPMFTALVNGKFTSEAS